MNKRIWIILLTIITVAIIIKLKVPLGYDGVIYLLFIIAMEVAELSMYYNRKPIPITNIDNLILLYNRIPKTSISLIGRTNVVKIKLDGINRYIINNLFELTEHEVLKHCENITNRIDFMNTT